MNASQYVETENRVKPSSSACVKTPPGGIKWAPASAVSVIGWTGAPAGLAPRQLQTLSIQESIDLMDRVRQDYLVIKFLMYRKTTLLDTDDDADTLSADESDLETLSNSSTGQSSAADGSQFIDHIFSSINEFLYDRQAHITFDSWYKRYEDMFSVDLAAQDDAWKV
ncbi:unnamed protein product [Schistocephalus solidus]|uniref:DUF7083 domain-containing protein n=1 Tax=Schistocephalus solidus TaxID=70667 RepID=A0A3P7E343_SCHSO|nr:unnamed protein product [Schistocephalus solidus]